ncbi:MAG: helix-turn-helix domain-containing protein [Solirubrobacteraceae bacterium]
MPRTATSDIASLVVGRAIRAARRGVGMTQAELAAQLGTSAAYVSGVETGRANPTVGQLSAVANALGVELEVTFRIPQPITEPVLPTADQLLTESQPSGTR